MHQSKVYATIPANTYNNQADMLTAFAAIIDNANRDGYHFMRYRCILKRAVFTMVTSSRALYINADQTIWIDETIVEFAAKWVYRHQYDKNGNQSHTEYTDFHEYEAQLVIL